MDEGRRNAIVVTVLYIVFLCGTWTWFHPYFVNQRVRGHISIGAIVQESEKTFQVRTMTFQARLIEGWTARPTSPVLQ